MAFARNIAASIVSIIGLFCTLPILFLTLPFWVTSLLTRACNRLVQPRYVLWDEIIAYEPYIGWKPKPDLNTHYLSRDEDVCHIRTDAQGWVGEYSLAESDIVVFGDSFAFGYGVNLCDSYITLNPSLKIKAIGAPGYNMVQELLLMRQHASQLTNKLVVWFICLENDLLDNLRPNSLYLYRTPFIRRVGGDKAWEDHAWEIVTGHVSPTKWPYPTIRHPYAAVFAQLFTTTPLSEFVYSSCEFLLREGYDLCHQIGACLVILTIPKKSQMSQQGLQLIASSLEDSRKFDPDFLDRRFRTICHKLSLPYISAREYLQIQDYKKYDWHWSQKGHRQISEILANLHYTYESGELSSSRVSF